MTLVDDVPTGASRGVRIVVLHPGVHLRRQHQPVATTIGVQELSQSFLAGAAPIDVCRVDRIDTRVQGVVEEPGCICRIWQLVQQHGAERERADLNAGSAQTSVVHQGVQSGEDLASSRLPGRSRPRRKSCMPRYLLPDNVFRATWYNARSGWLFTQSALSAAGTALSRAYRWGTCEPPLPLGYRPPSANSVPPVTTFAA